MPKQSRDEELKPPAKAGRGRGSESCNNSALGSRAQQANHVSPSTSLEFASTKGGTALERGVLARAIPPLSAAHSLSQATLLGRSLAATSKQMTRMRVPASITLTVAQLIE